MKPKSKVRLVARNWDVYVGEHGNQIGAIKEWTFGGEFSAYSMSGASTIHPTRAAAVRALVRAHKESTNGT